ncbi:MAG: hypothetical protein WCJ51_02855 [Candidatus Moraniibacteriota bacterium]
MRDMDPEILRKRKKLQVELVLKDSDAKKAEREKILLEVEIRGLKNKQQQLTVEMATKEVKLKKTQQDLLAIQNELVKMKHQLNSLH